jgi:hypothetical protein
MAKLDWEKAKRQEAVGGRKRPKGNRQARQAEHVRQMALVEFVTKHDLSCFKCGDQLNKWAKTGVSRRGPWAICVDCVVTSKR